MITPCANSSEPYASNGPCRINPSGRSAAGTAGTGSRASTSRTPARSVLTRIADSGGVLIVASRRARLRRPELLEPQFGDPVRHRVQRGSVGGMSSRIAAAGRPLADRATQDGVDELGAAPAAAFRQLDDCR